MKIFLISVLLCFEVCSGFSVRKEQHKRSANTDVTPGETDVYEVRERGDSTVKLTHPKPEKPTLREIVYYHLIEYPYEDQGGNHTTATAVTGEEPDGNGEEPPANDEDNDLGQRNGDEDMGGEYDEHYDSADPIEEEVGSDDKNEVKRIKLDVRNRNGLPPSDKKVNSRNVLFDQAKTKYITRTTRQEKPSPKHKREISYKDLPPAPTLPPLNLGAFPEYIRKVIPTQEPELKTALKDQLTHFDEEDITDNLEKRIDNIISSIQPDNKDDKSDTEENDDNDDNGSDNDDDSDTDDDDSDTDDDDDDDDYWEDSDEDDDEPESPSNDGHAENATIKQTPRTYGMNLTMGRGYVWNDLMSKPGYPGMSYDIGKSTNESDNTRDKATKAPETTKKPEESVISAKPEENKTNSGEISIPAEPFTNVPHATESRPINNENPSSEHAPDNELNTNADPNDVEENKPDKEPLDNENLDDIIFNIFKPHTNTDEKENKDKESKPVTIDKEPLDNENLEDIIVNIFKPHTNTDEKENKDKESKPVTIDISKNKEYDIEEYKLKTNKEAHHKKDKHKHKSIQSGGNDSLKELMNNEEFWKWLNGWTSTYMELLMEHIKKLVEEEVSKQMKIIAAKFEKVTPFEDKNEQHSKEKDERDDSHNNYTDEDKNGVNFIRDDNQFIDGEKKELTSPDTSTHDPDRLRPSPDINTLIHDDNRFTGFNRPPQDFNDDNGVSFPFGGVPFTHASNFDINEYNNEKNEFNYNKNVSEEESNDLADFLRNKKQKQGSENKKMHNKKKHTHKDNKNKSPMRISATNIYGNSAGSEKVTNIFVFYPPHNENNGTHEDNILTSIVPSVTGVSNIFVSDKPDIDKRVPEISKQKDESSDDSNKPKEEPSDKDPESQTEPASTTPKENLDEIQNDNKTSAEESKTSTKQQNPPVQPQADNQNQNKDDIKVTTIETVNHTETTTISSIDQTITKTSEQENKTPITEQNKKDQPKEDDLSHSKDSAISTTESVSKTESTTILSTTIKEEIETKPPENKGTDDVKVGNETESSTVSPKTENTETTMISSIDQTITKTSEQENKSPITEQNKTDQTKEDDLSHSKDGAISTTESVSKTENTTILSTTIKEEIETKPSDNKGTDDLKVGNETESSTVSPKIENVLDSVIEVTTAATTDKKIQDEEKKEKNTEQKESQSTEHQETLTEERIKEIEAKVERDLQEKISKQLELKIEEEFKTKIYEQISSAIVKVLAKAENKETEPSKKDGDLKEEPEKEVGKEGTSEKDSEKKGEDVVLAA